MRCTCQVSISAEANQRTIKAIVSAIRWIGADQIRNIAVSRFIVLVANIDEFLILMEKVQFS